MRDWLQQSIGEWVHLVSGITIIVLSVWTIYLGREVTWQEPALYLVGAVFCLNRFWALWKLKEKEYIGFKHYMFFAAASLVFFILGLLCI